MTTLKAATRNIPYTNEIFIRTRMRPDKNLERTGVSPKKILRVFNWVGVNTTYNDMFESFYPGSGLPTAFIAGGTQPPTSYPKAGDNSASSDFWHKMEYYINTSGVIKVWHDGVLSTNYSGYPTGNAKWLPFYITSNWSDAHDAVNSVYFDDFEIFTDKGTGGTGSMANGTAAAP